METVQFRLAKRRATATEFSGVFFWGGILGTCADALGSANYEDVFSFEVFGVVFFATSLNVAVLRVEPA